MKLYTKKGDTGKTSILGEGNLFKDDSRIEAYGTIDELNSLVGMLYHNLDETFHEDLSYIQTVLFEIGSDLASEKPRNRVSIDDVTRLEILIDKSERITPDLKSFILPGGTIGSSWLHMARSITRRAERRIVAFLNSNDGEIAENIIPWINRLSDLFFSWARLDNFNNNQPDIVWESRLNDK